MLNNHILLDQVILLFEIYLKEIILITEKALCTKGISYSIVLFGLKKIMYIHWMEYYVAFKYVYLKLRKYSWKVETGYRMWNTKLYMEYVYDFKNCGKRRLKRN